jgi:hypothetical protein
MDNDPGSTDMSYTLPARVVLDMVCSILDAQREQLRRRQAKSPKSGRARQIDQLAEQIRLCGPNPGEPLVETLRFIDTPPRMNGPVAAHDGFGAQERLTEAVQQRARASRFV